MDRLTFLGGCGLIASALVIVPARGEQPPQGSPTPKPAAKDEQVPPAPGAAGEKEAADRLLRSKGLRPEGPIYVLEREDDVKKLALKLKLVAQEFDYAVAQRNLQAQAIANNSRRIAYLQQEQRALYAAMNTAPVIGVPFGPTNSIPGGQAQGNPGTGQNTTPSQSRGQGNTGFTQGNTGFTQGNTGFTQGTSSFIPYNNSGNPGQANSGQNQSQNQSQNQNQGQRASSASQNNTNAIIELNRRKAEEKAKEKQEECGEDEGESEGEAEACGVDYSGQIVALNQQIAQLGSMMMQAQVDYNRFGMIAMTKESEFRRGRIVLDSLADEVRKRYAELGEEAEVKTALITLNRGSELRYGLGPADDYKANLEKLAVEVLKSKGVLATRGGNFIIGSDADSKTLAFLAFKFRSELATALRRQLDQQSALKSLKGQSVGHAKRIASLTAALAAAPPAAKEKLATELKKAQDDAAKHAGFEAKKEEELQSLALEIAGNREAFVQSVENLGKSLEKSKKTHDTLAGDDEAKAAINALTKKAAGQPKKSGSGKLQTKALDPARKEYDYDLTLIKTEPVPLEPDRTAPRLSATINGVAVKKLVVDPSEKTVRVSERLAATIGLRGNEGEPRVTVTMTDGQELSAMRATLKSVRIGNFEVSDVACLIVLDGYDGPPVLGANFLDRFLYTIDADAGKLTLTRVDVLPASPFKAGNTPKTKGRPNAGG